LRTEAFALLGVLVNEDFDAENVPKGHEGAGKGRIVELLKRPGRDKWDEETRRGSRVSSTHGEQKGAQQRTCGRW
jgi:hypothetical protein